MLKPAILMTSLSALSITSASAAPVTLNYWMWDPAQKIAYQQCVDAFHKLHPDIAVNISQFGWNDYWTGLTTAFVSHTAPDVFVNNVWRFAEYLDDGQMVNLSPLAKKDNVATNIYRPGLVELWSDKNGDLYGLPKDWDTITIIYNVDALKKTNIDPATLNNLTWNPQDGGTFGKLIAELSVDQQGRNALDPKFDKANVAQYGLVNSRYDGIGQVGWSHLAYENGFNFLQKSWGGDWNYDSPKLAETFGWLRQLALDGKAVPQSQVGDLGGDALFAAGKAAMTFAGDWQINDFLHNAKFKFAFAPLPTGPLGRKSMLNGIADSIWTGTQHPDEAWTWVKFLGSMDCEKLIGASGVVFPAIPAAAEMSVKAHAAQGIDVMPFIEEATPDQTFLYPVTYHGSEVLSIINPALDKIFLGTDPIAPILKNANDQVKALY
jgi:multiple sugar transport system substrate-binding protein